MKDVEVVRNILSKHGIKWDVKEFNAFLNPGCKSAKSIEQKVLRIYNSNPAVNFLSLLDCVDDFLRITIIIDYKEVTNTITELKNKFDDLSGYLQIEEAGYRGIHLNTNFEGVPCEIQLSPKVVVSAVDFLHTLYEKWRNFDADFEKKLLKQKEQEISTAPYDNAKKECLLKAIDEQRKSLDIKIIEQQTDKQLRQKIYAEIYKIAEFEKYQADVSLALKLLNKQRGENSTVANADLKTLLNQNLIINKSLDLPSTQKVIASVEKMLPPLQERFASLVLKSLGL